MKLFLSIMFLFGCCYFLGKQDLKIDNVNHYLLVKNSALIPQELLFVFPGILVSQRKKKGTKKFFPLGKNQKYHTSHVKTRHYIKQP